MIWLDDTTGAVEAIPHTRHIKGNFVFRISFRGQTSNLWALDKDDGSSNYNETDNVLFYGAIKDRDGRDRAASELVLTAGYCFIRRAVKQTKGQTNGG